MDYSTELLALVLISIVTFFIINYITRKKTNDKNQINRIFVYSLWLVIIWNIGLIAQIFSINLSYIDPIYFDYFTYISICLMPISVLFMGIVFCKNEINLSRRHLLLFIVPIITLLVLWTNDYHHLFYKVYDIELTNVVTGPYAYIHSVYSYGILVIGLVLLVKGSIKNSGFFSRQSILLIVGSLVPIILNFIGTFKIIPLNIYMTPIAFAFFLFCCAIAMFRFQFLSIAPIALERIVDRMSDLYVVINANYNITEFNKPFSKLLRTLFKRHEGQGNK